MKRRPDFQIYIDPVFHWIAVTVTNPTQKPARIMPGTFILQKVTWIDIIIVTQAGSRSSLVIQSNSARLKAPVKQDLQKEVLRTGPAYNLIATLWQWFEAV